MSKFNLYILLAVLLSSCNTFELIGEESFNDFEDKLIIENVNISNLGVSGTTACDIISGFINVEGRNFKSIQSMNLRNHSSGFIVAQADYSYATTNDREIVISLVAAMTPINTGDYDIEINFVDGEFISVRSFHIDNNGGSGPCSINSLL
jgi:hypothetical protein